MLPAYLWHLSSILQSEIYFQIPALLYEPTAAHHSKFFQLCTAADSGIAPNLSHISWFHAISSDAFENMKIILLYILKSPTYGNTKTLLTYGKIADMLQ